METYFRSLIATTLLFFAATVTLTVSAQDLPLRFKAGDIYYEKVPGDWNGVSCVMVCSPYTPGMEYTYPVEGDGLATVQASVTYGGKEFAVTALDREVFFNNEAIREIRLPESLRDIGDSNFRNCPNLTGLDLCRTETLGNDCVSDVPALTELVFPENALTVAAGCFRGTALTAVTVPAGVTGLSTDNFSDNPRLASLDLSATTIRSSLWLTGCPALKILRLPVCQRDWLRESFLGPYVLDELWMPEEITEQTTFTIAFPNIDVRTIYNPSPVPPVIDNGYDTGENLHTFGARSMLGKNPVIYIPQGTRGAYSTSPTWSIFTDFREIDFAAVNRIQEDFSTDSQDGEFYTISGTRIPGRPSEPGIYIVKEKDSVRKVSIR